MKKMKWKEMTEENDDNEMKKMAKNDSIMGDDDNEEWIYEENENKRNVENNVIMAYQ